MKTRSLKYQVIGSILLAETLCGAAFTGAALVHEWHVRVQALDATLRGRADSLLGAIQDAEDPDDNVLVDPTELEIPKEDVYAVYNRGGRLLGASADAAAELIDRRTPGMSTRKLHGRTYRVLQRDGTRIIDRSETAGVGLRRPVTILYAVSSEHLWHEVREGVGFTIALGSSLILVTAFILIVLLRKVLRPLDELAVEAGNISIRSLQFNAPLAALRLRELRPLAETLATTVQSLRRSFEQQARFVGDAAHELKTAVAVVRSSIQLLLLRPREASEYRIGVETLLLDNSRVEDLVARMLILARFDEQASQRDLASEATADVLAAAHRVLGRLRPYTMAREVEVSLHSQARLCVQLLSDELDVLLSNLIVNAVQHSLAGKEVRVSIVGGVDFAELTIEDFGTGISAEALPHVFERFYREDASRSRDTGGAGLGLAICKSIVDAAQGTLSLESTRGLGTRVHVQLPLARLPSGSLNLER